MTEVIFSFDTEDFTSNRSADAIRDLANIFAEEGVTAHFAVVGLLASQLTAWGRDDVKAALKKHIIGTHTYGHTLHPSVCELSDDVDYNKSHSLVMENERKGISLIKENLGRDDIMYAVPPGNGDSYVGAYCYSEMGIPFYMDGCVHDGKNTLVDYCGSTRIPYVMSLEGLFFGGSYEGGKYLDEMAKYDRVVIYNHPNMAVKKKFWDALNYNRENLCSFGEWKQADDRKPEDTAEFYENIRMFIRTVKADARFKITNLREIKARIDKNQPQPITLADIADIKKKLGGKVQPIGAYCASDLIYAAAELLRGKSSYTPDTKAVRGFLSEPVGVGEAVTLTADDVRKAANQIKTGDFIPSSITVGEKTVGPADYLFAALDVLSGMDEVTVTPAAQSVAMPDFTDLAELHLAGTWLHSLSMKDEYLSDRLRLQSWTLRYRER